MESSTRSYQITARKLSSFEDLFVKMSSLHALKILKMSFKSNGLVNLDFKMMGLCVASLEGLESLNLNIS